MSRLMMRSSFLRQLVATAVAATMFGAPSAFAAGGKKKGGGDAAAAAPAAGGAAPAGGAPAAGGDDFGFDIVEEKVTDTDKQKVEDAKDLLAQERFGEALGAFDAILQDPKLKKFHESVQYDMCKAFYKMEAYHASLACFQKILDTGPKHSMYAQSRNWLFFIARKIKDELAALRLIARYAKIEDIPAEYQSELGYSLGRYYFLTALEQGAKGVEVEQKDDKPVEDKGNSGALDIEGTGDKDKKDDKKDDKGKKDDKKEDDGGFNFNDTDLGGGDGDFGYSSKPGFSDVSSSSDADDVAGANGFRALAGPRRILLAQDDDFGMGGATVKETKKGAAKKGPAKNNGKASDAKKKEEEAKKKAEEEAAKKKTDETPVAGATTSETKEDKSPSHAFDGPKNSDEALKLSLENLGRVKQDFSLYAQSIYIKGLVHFAKGEFDPAVKEFREVVRMTNPRTGTVKNEKLREMAFFSLARIHYQFEQFRYAIFYYDRIDRDSEQWLEALFESSWAHFRLGEYQKALGNLVTLQSPFFQDEYYPEAAILKAITFYENCRYPEARAFLGEFKQNYGGVLTELSRLIGDDVGGVKDAKDSKATGTGAAGAKGEPKPEPKSATQLFDELTDLEKKVAEGRDDQSKSFALTARLLRLALSDKRVKQYREAIDEVDDEKQRIAALGAPFAGGKTQVEMTAAIDARRAELVHQAGTLLREKLSSERAFLQDLTGKLIRIQFEITKGEKEKLEASLSGVTNSQNNEDYRDSPAVDDERLYWPFEGEYWRDELGTYQYTLTKGCKPPADTTITGNE